MLSSTFFEKLWDYTETQDENRIAFWFHRGRVWGWLPCYKKIIPLIEDEILLRQIVLFLLKLKATYDSDMTEIIKYFSILPRNILLKNVIEELSTEKDFIELVFQDMKKNKALKVVFFYKYLNK